LDQVLKKAMEKRDEALREVERWETWVKAYAELVGPLEPLDTLMPRGTSPVEIPADDLNLDIATTLRQPNPPVESSKGRGSWLRNGNAPN
jgi:hypothetical protein